MKTKQHKLLSWIIIAAIILFFPTSIIAQEMSKDTIVPKIDSGDTAWMIVASALVMLMTMPGLALFYGGLVRRKNILNVMMQCFILMALLTIEWIAIGYSLAFGSSYGILKPFIGNFDLAFLRGISVHDLSPYYISKSQPTADGGQVGTIPHIIFVLFQCKFAVITPALIIGAFAERISFKGFILFSLIWAIIVYNPVAHWVWSADGWLYKLGALDFAGGTVVHVNAGIAALVTAILIGKRKDYRNVAIPPHNIPFVVIGASLLWFGWFGFNAGSGLAADGLAANAFLVTHTAAAAAAATWGILEWILHGRPSTIGIATGAVAGLVAITPAAGFVGTFGSLLIGFGVSVICYYFVGVVKPYFGYDDSLDAFGVHGIGGLWGAIATGIFVTPTVQGAYSGLITGNPKQVLIQLAAVGATIIYSAIMTFIIFKIIDKTIGIRVSPKEEALGLDYSMHKEEAYSYID
jgi:Amt family ammonium transporter